MPEKEDQEITSSLQFNEAPKIHRDKGVIGWVSFTIFDAFRLSAVVVKENHKGGISLVYPANQKENKLYHYVRPINNHTRLKVEEEILGAIGYASHQMQEDRDEDGEEEEPHGYTQDGEGDGAAP